MYIYPSPFTGASLHLLIACKLSWKNLPCGAEPRIELGPALSYSKPKRYTNICNSWIYGYIWECRTVYNFDCDLWGRDVPVHCSPGHSQGQESPHLHQEEREGRGQYYCSGDAPICSEREMVNQTFFNFCSFFPRGQADLLRMKILYFSLIKTGISTFNYQNIDSGLRLFSLFSCFFDQLFLNLPKMFFFVSRIMGKMTGIIWWDRVFFWTSYRSHSFFFSYDFL